jgi:hypothetical protein
MSDLGHAEDKGVSPVAVSEPSATHLSGMESKCEQLNAEYHMYVELLMVG